MPQRPDRDRSEVTPAGPLLVVAVLLLMLAALVLRLWGIGFGRDIGAPLEFSYHLDEPITLLRAVSMSAAARLVVIRNCRPKNSFSFWPAFWATSLISRSVTTRAP